MAAARLFYYGLQSSAFEVIYICDLWMVETRCCGCCYSGEMVLVGDRWHLQKPYRHFVLGSCLLYIKYKQFTYCICVCFLFIVNQLQAVLDTKCISGHSGWVWEDHRLHQKQGREEISVPNSLILNHLIHNPILTIPWFHTPSTDPSTPFILFKDQPCFYLQCCPQTTGPLNSSLRKVAVTHRSPQPPLNLCPVQIRQMMIPQQIAFDT